MAGDYSRIAFDPQDDFALVQQQQGRIFLDWEWNLQGAIRDHGVRVQTIDTMGHAAVPRETPTGFQIKLGIKNGKPTLFIGPGRMYVDGILVSNYGVGSKIFDNALEEIDVTQTITDEQFVDYYSQRYWLLPAKLPEERYRVFLDVWRREVTFLQIPHIVEQAVGEETTARLQTVWQVKFAQIGEGESAACDLPDELTRPPEGRLSTKAVEIPSDENPCILPPRGGYGGTDNRLYRCEIHRPGKAKLANAVEGDTIATFKWSRDNGSVAAALEAIKGTVLTISRTRRNLIEEFRAGDWIEILDDEIELDGRSGEMHKVKNIRPGTLEIELDTAPSLTIEAGRHGRVVRWDQKGIIRDSAGNIYVNVDTSNGVIPVPPPNISLILEAGVQVTFSTAPTLGLPPASAPFRAQDYWTFVARIADASVERLDQAPPRGIHHHYASLAIVTPAGTDRNNEPMFSVEDCRKLWPDEEETTGCACSICVSPEAHNSGKLTIQSAINRLKKAGGTVCLEPGTYELRLNRESRDAHAPIELSQTQSPVRIQGHGEATRLLSRDAEVAILVRDSESVTLADLMIVAPAGKFVEGQEIPHAGAVTILNSISTTVERCTIEVWTLPVSELSKALFVSSPQSPVKGGIAIALGGFILESAFLDNRLSARSGIVCLDMAAPTKNPVIFVASKVASVTAALRIERNSIHCIEAGIDLGQATVHLGRTDIVDNTIVQATRVGILASGLVWPIQYPNKPSGQAMGQVPPQLFIGGNAVNGAGDGIVSGPRSVRIYSNNVTGTFSPNNEKDVGGSGIVITQIGQLDNLSIDQSRDQGCEIRSNRVSWMGGDGIVLRVGFQRALIEGNFLQDIVGSGILMTERSQASSLTIENNELVNLGLGIARTLVGIRVVQVQKIAIEGNTIAGLDRTGRGPQINRFGIQVFACSSIRIAGNDLSGVGLPAGVQAFGIAVEPSFEALDVYGNHVHRSELAQDTTDVWEGLRIEAGRKGKELIVSLLSGTSLGGMVLHSNVLNLLLGIGVTRIPRGAETIGVHGNLFQSTGGVHAVNLTVDGMCSFSNNRCIQPILRHEHPVSLKAGALLVQSNYVEGPKEIPGMKLDVPDNLGHQALTLIGNICTKDIIVNRQSLVGQTWASLNVLAV